MNEVASNSDTRLDEQPVALPADVLRPMTKGLESAPTHWSAVSKSYTTLLATQQSAVSKMSGRAISNTTENFEAFAAAAQCVMRSAKPADIQSAQFEFAKDQSQRLLRQSQDWVSLASEVNQTMFNASWRAFTELPTSDKS